MSDDPLHAMILDTLERGRRGNPVPCHACGTPTPPDQVREAAVPDHHVDFGGYHVTLRRVRQFCPACWTGVSGQGPRHPARPTERTRKDE